MPRSYIATEYLPQVGEAPATLSATIYYIKDEISNLFCLLRPCPLLCWISWTYSRLHVLSYLHCILCDCRDSSDSSVYCFLSATWFWHVGPLLADLRIPFQVFGFSGCTRSNKLCPTNCRKKQPVDNLAKGKLEQLCSSAVVEPLQISFSLSLPAMGWLGWQCAVKNRMCQVIMLSLGFYVVLVIMSMFVCLAST